MALKENPIIRKLRQIEKRPYFDTGVNRKSLLGWLKTFDSFPEASPEYQSRLWEIIDTWRRCPIIDDFGELHNNGPLQQLDLIPSAQYQINGEWNHAEKTVDELSALLENNNDFVLLIENFAKKGKVVAVTNLLYLLKSLEREVPQHFALEALYWTELTQARQFFDREEGKKESKKVRVHNLPKKDVGTNLHQDPFYHLYMAYLLLCEFEKLLTQ